MFERFTESARQVVVLSQEEARTMRHPFIGSEHVLLGLAHEGGVAARLLEHSGAPVEALRSEVLQLVPPGEDPLPGQIPFTGDAKRSLEYGLKEALALGDRHIGTKHLLLGLLRLDDSTAVKALSALGVEGGDLAGRAAEAGDDHGVELAAGGSRGTFPDGRTRVWTCEITAVGSREPGIAPGAEVVARGPQDHTESYKADVFLAALQVPAGETQLAVLVFRDHPDDLADPFELYDGDGEKLADARSVNPG